MSATFEVSREYAAAKLSVLSAHLADSIARLLTLPYIYLDFVKMISTIKKLMPRCLFHSLRDTV